MDVAIAAIAGILVGGIVTLIFIKSRFKVLGALRVDNSDPDEPPYLFLELSNRGADAIYKQRYATFKVCVKNYISQK